MNIVEAKKEYELEKSNVSFAQWIYLKWEELVVKEKQLEEDVDFLCTWCAYLTPDKEDPLLQHHQDIIKRWKSRNNPVEEQLEELKETIILAYFAEDQQETDDHLLNAMQNEKFKFNKDKKISRKNENSS